MAATMVLTACGSATPTASAPTNSSGQVALTVDEKVASLLPAEYKGKTLKIGFEAGALPWADLTPDGSSMQGLDYDLMQAATAVLGVKAEYEGTSFTNIIPGVQGGRYDLGISSFYDTPEREKIVDEVTYGSDGQILITKKGGKTGLTEDTLCGLKVAVVASNLQAEQMPVKSENCVSEGKQPIAVQVYPTQAEQYLSVTSGRADVLNTGGSNGGYLVKTSPDAFEQAGPPFATVPVAIVLKKDSPLSEAMAAAVNKLIENGTYAKLFDKWGLSDWTTDEAKVNPATTGK
jgi:polar amino acid transport system substrate-binding protein